MAELPVPQLVFRGGCPDCGEREVALPEHLPPLGDDFDWRVRDYDSFRLFMLEELAARFPERTRWTPADLEVVLVESFAAVLDQLSDMLDRVTAEAYLETARRPDSVRRLLGLIGYDAVEVALADGEIRATDPPTARAELDRHWLSHPDRMEAARQAGPRAIHDQRRMVTTADYALRLEEHPLVRRATSWGEWGGSWTTLRVAAIAWQAVPLDRPGASFPEDVRDQVARFHRARGVPVPTWGASTTIRTILNPYLERYRMIGQEVVLQDAHRVPIVMAISVRLDEDYFRSEIRRAVAERLGVGPGGFFEAGRLRFGEDLYASDVVQALMELEGVENVCLNRFKRLGREHPDEAEAGVILLSGIEMVACDSDPLRPQAGYYRLTLHGGRPG